MNLLCRPLVPLLLLCLFPCLPTARAGEADAKPTIIFILEAAAELAQFEKTKELEHFEKAFHAMTHASHPVTGSMSEQIQARQEQGRMWFNILAVLEGSMDPKFNPNNQPRLTAPAWAMPMFSGGSPESIEDPKARAVYKKALKKYSEEIKERNFQHRLRQMELGVSFCVNHFVESRYTTSVEDRKEFDQLFRESGVSEARKPMLKAHREPQKGLKFLDPRYSFSEWRTNKNFGVNPPIDLKGRAP